MLFKIILLFLITIKSILSLNSNDFCYSAESICLNKRECTQECNNLFRQYKCNEHLCTVNETMCDKYITEEWINLLRLSHSNRLNSLKSKIKYCTKAAFKLNPNDFCIKKSETCYKKRIKFNWLPINLNTRIRVNCPCNGSYSYECGDYFCAVNNKACDAFMNLKPNLKNKFKILKCN